MRAREYAGAFGGSIAGLIEAADAGLLTPAGEYGPPVRVMAAGRAAGFAAGAAQAELDFEPARQTVTAQVEARFAMTMPAGLGLSVIGSLAATRSRGWRDHGRVPLTSPIGTGGPCSSSQGNAAGAVGGDVLAIAAVPRVAVAAGPVAGQVDQDRVTVGSVTGPQPVSLPQPDQIGKREPGLGADPVRERCAGLGDVQVPAPSTAVVDQPGSRTGVAEQAVDDSGELVRAGGLPYGVKPRAERLDGGNIGRVWPGGAG